MDKEELDRIDEKEKDRKKVRLKLNDIYEPITIKDKNPFAIFLEMHYVPLPNSHSG